jgi:hypothetical protein
VKVAAGAGLLLLGVLVGVSAVWVHGRWWAFALGAAATVATELATPRGLLRVAFAVGWVLGAGYFLLARPEGDFVVGSDAIGYSFLALGLVVVVIGVATIAPRTPIPPRTGSSA